MNMLKEIDGKKQIVEEYIPLVKYIASRVMSKRISTWNMRIWSVME